MQGLERLTDKAFDDLYSEEALRMDADDERDDAEEKSGTKNQAIKDSLTEIDDMDDDHEKLARKLETAAG